MQFASTVHDWIPGKHCRLKICIPTKFPDAVVLEGHAICSSQKPGKGGPTQTGKCAICDVYVHSHDVAQLTTGGGDGIGVGATGGAIIQPHSSTSHISSG